MSNRGIRFDFRYVVVDMRDFHLAADFRVGRVPQLRVLRRHGRAKRCPFAQNDRQGSWVCGLGAVAPKKHGAQPGCPPTPDWAPAPTLTTD
jgi:hypothetical protein